MKKLFAHQVQYIIESFGWTGLDTNACRVENSDTTYNCLNISGVYG